MAIVLVDKIAPKNDAFTGLVHADQVIGGATGSTLKDNTVHVTNVTQWEGSITHNNLDGLTTGDPHTQYLETDGTRNLSDHWDVGSFRIGSLALPISDMDVTNKAYVDAQASGGYSGLGVETFGISGLDALSGAITIYPGTSTSIIRGGSNFTFNVSGVLTNNIIGSVTGDVIGDITGNITGSLLGDVTGNITGSILGNITGNLTGSILGNLTGSPTIVNNLSSGCVAADHGTASTDQVVNVCYGTGEPPAANTTTEGTLFIKYTA